LRKNEVREEMTNKEEISASKLMSMTRSSTGTIRVSMKRLASMNRGNEAVERVMNMHKEKYAAVLTPELYGIFMEIRECVQRAR
jgi:hypothetical protein